MYMHPVQTKNRNMYIFSLISKYTYTIQGIILSLSLYNLLGVVVKVKHHYYYELRLTTPVLVKVRDFRFRFWWLSVEMKIGFCLRIYIFTSPAH